MTIRAVITGVAGRMGSRIIEAVRDAEGIALCGATARPGASVVGLDAGLAAGLGVLEVTIVDALHKALEAGSSGSISQPAHGRADVVIDFTTPESSVEHAHLCAEKGVALVVGSTGFSADAKEAVAAAARKVPIVMAPNMSAGVNLMFQLTAEVARVLGADFDVEILEAHHAGKKDAPSGTALRLADSIARALGRDPTRDLTFARKGQIGARPEHEIGVQTLRGGDVVGEHTVFFFGQGERLEITHRATSRDTFARGAVRAALWVVGKPPGLYDMMDVLGFA